MMSGKKLSALFVLFLFVISPGGDSPARAAEDSVIFGVEASLPVALVLDKVAGLELGADDYIVKPFGMAELLARVRSALRRGALATEGQLEESTVFSFGSVRVDFASMSGLRGTVPFELTPREAELLRYLLARPNRVVSRDILLEELWGVECEITTRTVDQHIVRLRQKIEDDPSRPRWLQTVHGAGYRFISLQSEQGNLFRYFVQTVLPGRGRWSNRARSTLQ